MSKNKSKIEFLPPLLKQIAIRQGLKKKLTQRQFMIGLKADPSLWYRWKENGISESGIDTICAIYGVRKEYLLTGKGEFFEKEIDPTTLNIETKEQYKILFQQLKREITLKDEMIDNLKRDFDNFKKRLSLICDIDSIKAKDKLQMIKDNLELS